MLIDNDNLTFWERIKYFDYSLDPIIGWFSNAFDYYQEQFGVWGYVGLVVVIILALLSTSMFRPVTSFFLSTVFRNTIGDSIRVVMASVALALVWLARQITVKSRIYFKQFLDYLRT